MPARLYAAAALALACLATGVTATPADGRRPSTPPNILFILTDDMREDDLAYLPQAESLLADEGVQFSNYYTPYPLCCPSRTSFFTGMYVHNHHVEGIENGWQHFAAQGHEEDSLAPVLSAAGYTTGLFGKYLNGYDRASAVPPGWDEWDAKIDYSGEAAAYYNYDLSENGRLVEYGSQPDDYQTDVLSDKADSFIRGAEEPFFAYVATSAPHVPWTPAPRHVGAYGGDARAETLLAVDELIARLVGTLDEMGELDNTYILFASDNGWMLGEHGLDRGKLIYWEPSTSVQLVVRGPKVPAGKVVDELTANHDLGPTIAEIAGTALPHPDGRSLLPLLDGRSSWTREQLYLQNPLPDDEGRGPWRAVVDDDGYKLVKKPGPDELYNLHTDPIEEENLLGNVSPSLTMSLYERLAALSVCAEDTCREAEDRG